jgi:hypothetical protein
MSANGKTDILSPRQKEFWTLYNNKDNPKTYSNAYQSAIKAGYNDWYAQSIVRRLPKWMAEKVRTDFRQQLLDKAETVLKESLSYKEKYIKVDVAKFIARTQGKHSGYSERHEITGLDGKDLTLNIVQYKSKPSLKP